MAAASPSDKPDEVLLVQDFWDQPMSGVATFQGGFYAFQRIYDEAGQAWSSEFRLRPLSGVELAQFNEMDAIFKAWRAAYDSGKAGPHPLMPEAVGAAADRYKVLYQIIDGILHGETEQSLRCTGQMTAVGPDKRYVVHWQKQS
jgi:hypothetical protein